MITIFTSTFNDEIILPHFIKWYRDRFKGCKILVGDNLSTDRTREICLDNGCVFRPIDSGQYLPIRIGHWFKNNSWKEKTTDWVIFVDCDEFLDMNETDLIREDSNGSSLIRTTGWDIINLKDDFDVESMKHGCRNKHYDKIVCFKKSKIREMNYSEGGHYCDPEGEIKYSDISYNLLHKKYINLNFFVENYKNNFRRLHEYDANKNLGSHYNITEEDLIKKFEKMKKTCVELKIRT